MKSTVLVAHSFLKFASECPIGLQMKLWYRIRKGKKNEKMERRKDKRGEVGRPGVAMEHGGGESRFWGVCSPECCEVGY